MMFTFQIKLCENGPQASWFLSQTKTGIGDECVCMVSSGVANHMF